MKIHRILLSFIVLAQSTTLLADKESLYTKRIGTEQGLTNPGITAIHTTSDGVVWIGTRYLLNKYVNGELMSYDEQQTGGSYITMLFEDPDHNLWIGTERSLMKYDSQTDAFAQIYPERINCALEYNGKYYFAGKGNIVMYNPSDESIEQITAPTSYIIKSFVFTDDVLLFVDKYAGLSYFNIATGTIAKMNIPDIDNSTILSAFFDGKNLYLGVFYKGIFKIDQNGRIVQRYRVEDYRDLRLEAICDISKIGQMICLATDGSGICAIKDERIIPLTNIPNYSDLINLPSTTTVITEDNYSNIWIGSVHNGVMGIKPTRITSSNKYIALNKSEGRNYAVLALAKTDNTLWLGTEGGLFRYDTATQEYKLERNFKNDIITAIVPISSDFILVSSYCKGLFTLNIRNGNKKSFMIGDPTANQKEILSGYNINLNPISESEILILGENVYRYSNKSHRTEILSSDYGVSPAGLRVFYVSSDKRYGYAFSEDTFYHIDLIRNRISLLSKPDQKNKINTAVCIGGTIYFGTDNGLNSYHIESNKYDMVNRGLIKRVTHTCLRDDVEIWVASNNVLYSLDTDSGIVEIYDEAEGYSTTEVQASTEIGNNFYFGGIDNISIVPSDINISIDHVPSISLMGVHIDNIKQTIRKNGTVKVPYKHNNVEIHFVPKGDDPFRRTMMRYSISGPESNSIETHNYTYPLSRLSYGKFIVSASYLMPDGLWSPPSNYVSLIVNAPFWQRKWFILSIALLFAMISSYIIHRNANKSKKELQYAIQENKDKEKEKRYRFINGIESEMAKPIAQIIKLSRTILEAGENDKTSSESVRKNVEKIYSKSTDLEKIIEIAIQQEKPTQEENPIINKFNQLIDARISDQNLDVSVLVKEMAMSRTALYDKIKDLSGMGINEYIQNRRLILARKFLIETDMSMAEIADELGFSSAKYFSEIFKKYYEISPREFKKRISDKA